MLKILSKDMKTFFLFSAILMIPAFILWNNWKSDNFLPIAVFVQSALAYMITILTVMINEQDEDTNNGYLFIQTLPIRNRNVTFIKFSIPVIVIILLALINRGIYSLFSVTSDILGKIDSITIIFSTLFLINAGMIILGIYLFGYTKFLQFISGFIASVVFGSLIISKLFKYDKGDLGKIATSIEQWLMSGDHYLFILSGLLIYAVMGFVANLIEKK